jgi:PKD repeat protein
MDNPAHCKTPYTPTASPGTYTVKLNHTNDGGSVIEEKTDYITLLSCDLAVTDVNCRNLRYLLVKPQRNHHSSYNGADTPPTLW